MSTRAVFVDHSYHERTGSSNFLKDLLADAAEVFTLWDRRWEGGVEPGAVEINQLQPDVLLYYQSIPSAEEIAKVCCGNRVWVPMWDDVQLRPLVPLRLYMRSLGFRVLNFSAHCHEQLGIEGIREQYFPSVPATLPERGPELRLIFWQRREEINWSTLRSLIAAQPPAEITLRNVADPGVRIMEASAAEREFFNVRILDGWLSRAKYLEELSRQDIFLAPRISEGIGFSILEAMARGLCVLSSDSVAANEYLEHGRNGLLFDPNNPVALDLREARQLGAEARRDIMKGRQQWLNAVPRIRSFLLGE